MLVQRRDRVQRQDGRRHQTSAIVLLEQMACQQIGQEMCVYVFVLKVAPPTHRPQAKGVMVHDCGLKP